VKGKRHLMGANTKRLVYFEEWVDPVAERILGQRSEIDLVRLKYVSNEPENWRQIELAHGYQIQPRTELQAPWFADAALLRRCPRLLAVCSTGAGHDVIDVEACTAAGVIVCNQSGTNKEAVAQHAVGFMLSLSKKIATSDKAMRKAIPLERYALTGNDLTGKVVGIVGIGHIGTRTAELCQAFGMEVVAYDPYLNADEVRARGARKVGFEELLRTADFVSVHCPRSSETFGMFGSEQFAQMKSSAHFLNTARGGIHKEDELAAAIAQGRIAGAGIDVFLKEPPAPDHPLLHFENVIVTPHIAGITFEALHNMALAAAEQWITIFAGDVPPRLVNPEAWPHYAERFKQTFGYSPKLAA
jgi:D-3-phosphoglycerate dehydrogenase / 2-oxoglutarate reductase